MTSTSPTSVTIENDGTRHTYFVAIQTMARHEQPRPLQEPAVGLLARLDLARVEGARPDAYYLSLLVGETHWVIDDLFGSDGCPHWAHGFGARYLKCRTVPDELAALLDEAAQAAGLVEQIGRELPLVLSPAPN